MAVSVERRDANIQSDLGWQPRRPTRSLSPSSLSPDPSRLVRSTGTVTFVTTPTPGQYRVVIREHEYLSANYTTVTHWRRGRPVVREQPKRLLYAEIVEIDTALIGGPSTRTGTSLENEPG